MWKWEGGQMQSSINYKVQRRISKEMYFAVNCRKNEDHDNPKYAPFDYHEFVEQSAINQRASPDQPSFLDTIVFTDEPNLKVFCHDCRKEINKTTSILSGNSIYRCVGCFAKLQPSDVPYQVIKSLNFPLVEENWKAYHEILFLNFLQKHGFNNWADIRQQMDFYGAKFSTTQLQTHYYQCYLANDDFLPKILNNDNFFEKRDEHPSALRTAINPTSVLTFPSSLRYDQPHEQYDQIEDYQVERQVKIKKDNKRQKEQQSHLEFYNEKRKEFDIEYDPDAELMLANLEFRDDDSDEEKRMKFQLIDLYNRRLEKRNQIKHFVIQHRLLDENYQKEKHKYRTDLEKQAFEELKPVARFTTLAEYNELVQKVAFTKQLKSVIEGLRKFRRTHPSNFKSLQEFLNNQPEESKPRKKGHCENSIKTGKKVQQMLQKRFNLSKKQFENIVSSLAANGKKTVYKNIQAVMLQRNYE